MKKQNYKRELELAQQLAVEAGKAILPIYYGVMEVSAKADQTPVTNADVLANRIIQSGIQRAFPLDGIVSEELEPVAGGRRCWYIDPIDGTRGFVQHTDQIAVHIGLAVEEKAVLGIVYKPIAREMYFAVKGEGAYRLSPLGTQVKLQVQEHDPPIPSMDRDNVMSARYQNLAKRLGFSEKPITTGSEGLRVMKVAEGIADVHFSLNPSHCSTWDICAPFIIAEEAGAYTGFTDGQPITYFGQRKINQTFIVANSKTLADRVSEMIERS